MGGRSPPDGQRPQGRTEGHRRACAGCHRASPGDNDEGALDGHVVVTWRYIKRNALDQQFLKDTYPELYESCKRVTEVRRFTLVEDDQ